MHWSGRSGVLGDCVVVTPALEAHDRSSAKGMDNEPARAFTITLHLRITNRRRYAPGEIPITRRRKIIRNALAGKSPDGVPIAVFDDIRNGTANNRAQFCVLPRPSRSQWHAKRTRTSSLITSSPASSRWPAVPTAKSAPFD
jgi:hypothetical protein